MTYTNPFLIDFLPVFLGLLEAKNINPAQMELIIWDEEPGGRHLFERADTKDVLWQLGPELNALTIYTDRREYFKSFVQQMEEEHGLMTALLSKKRKKGASLMQSVRACAVVLDFEWEGSCEIGQISRKCSYVPIHKKPWKIGENLDILVPFGYNTVIVKRKLTYEKKFVNDRFEEGFYGDELFCKEG